MRITDLLQSSFFILLGICTASTIALTLNDTTSVSTSDITCYEPAAFRVPVTIAKCRSLLKLLTTFPRYRAIQDFQIGRYPRLPGTPPYTWWNSSTLCGLRVTSYNPYIIQKFAWVQVRAWAIDILEFCEENSFGLGGSAPIGTPAFGLDGFSVRVVGVTIAPPAPPDGTDAFGSSGTANVTVGETILLDTS